jgi:hypothetical protein
MYWNRCHLSLGAGELQSDVSHAEQREWTGVFTSTGRLAIVERRKRDTAARCQEKEIG